MGLFDAHGRMVAQAITGTPGHVNTLAELLKYFLERFPPHTMCEGDQFITNDPWHASGHLHDLTVARPVFRNGSAIAFLSCCCHQVDIGGLGQGADGRSVYEEGLQISPMRLVKSGRLNDELLELIGENVRTPAQVRGDILSYVTANEMAGRQLLAMLDELALDDIGAASATILDRSQRAVETAIAALPKGQWRHCLIADGYDTPVTLAATLTIGERDIVVDFDGSSAASSFGINCVANYCLAYTAFALKCIVAPEVPNNTGLLAPFKVTAPSGTIVSAPRPWPVSARHLIGQLLPDVVFGCLDQAIRRRVPAEGASCIWTVQLRRGPDQAGGGAPMFETAFFNTGGSGARPHLDGLSSTAFPSGVRAIPIEVVEHGAPIVVWRKEFLPDFRRRRRISRRSRRHHRGWRAPCRAILCCSRSSSASKMLRGVAPAAAPAGPAGSICDPARSSVAKGWTIPTHERLVLETPGGAGYGGPRNRDTAALHQDVTLGLVSREAAGSEYGLAPSQGGSANADRSEQSR